jgi:hypothetical protein
VLIVNEPFELEADQLWGTDLETDPGDVRLGCLAMRHDLGRLIASGRCGIGHGSSLRPFRAYRGGRTCVHSAVTTLSFM